MMVRLNRGGDLLMDVRDDFLLARNEVVEQNEKLSAKSKRRLQKSKAFNTIKSYASDWNDFASTTKSLPCPQRRRPSSTISTTWRTMRRRTRCHAASPPSRKTTSPLVTSATTRLTRDLCETPCPPFAGRRAHSSTARRRSSWRRSI